MLIMNKGPGGTPREPQPLLQITMSQIISVPKLCHTKVVHRENKTVCTEKIIGIDSDFKLVTNQQFIDVLQLFTHPFLNYRSHRGSRTIKGVKTPEKLMAPVMKDRPDLQRTAADGSQRGPGLPP